MKRLEENAREKLVRKNEPILCFVKEGRAYFTPRSLDEQTLIKNKFRSPYQCNASIPYEDDIHILCFSSARLEAKYILDSFSVDQINSKEVPWLSDKDLSPIYAGTTWTNFINLIKAEKYGRVWIELEKIPDGQKSDVEKVKDRLEEANRRLLENYKDHEQGLCDCDNCTETDDFWFQMGPVPETWEKPK